MSFSKGFNNNFSNPGRQGSRIQKFVTRNPPVSQVINKKYKHNTILLVCDQMINFKHIPEKILAIMPGYQAFKSLGIQFNNIYNNRQDCSPSRASFVASQINVNVNDNIDQSWQYLYNPQLNTSFDTIGKSLKRNGHETAWYGKNHFVASIATDVYVVPAFNTNSRGCLREYGYDIFSTYGDSYYYSNEGMFADNIAFDCKINNSNPDFDFEDSSGKYIGAIPYLKARAKDDKPFHLELHLENPHDTQHFWQNLSQLPTKTQLQFWSPYINEQVTLLKYLNPDKDIYNPYDFSESFPDAYIKNPNLFRNYFEDVFLGYIGSTESLPFKDSYLNDYVLDPSSNNSQFSFFVGFAQSLISSTSFPTDKNDIMSWKNLINNYYGLLLEIDNYIFKVFLTLKNNNMLDATSVIIMADHGDMMSSHGLKQKGVTFENSCNVPCLIYSPYIPNQLRGTTSNVLGSLLDIAPTIETLANIKIKSRSFSGKSLINWVGNNIVPRVIDEPVFNIYNAWMTTLCYFSYASWYSNAPDNTILSDYNPTSYLKFQAFTTLIVDKIGGKKYKLTRYFNVIELFLYNFMFNSQFQITITADMINSNLSSDVSLNLLQNDVDTLKNIVETYFSSNSWNFKNLYNYIISIRGNKDDIVMLLFISSIMNIINSSIGCVFMIPGYYNTSYTIYNSFMDYYNAPDNNYYFFMYNVTDDPNELTNLLDKGYPDRQTSNVLNMASVLNNKMNLLIDKYKLIKFDMTLPTPLIDSLIINLKLQNNSITPENYVEYLNCFNLNKFDGDKKSQPYFDKVVDILKKL